jgi:hypothetical protein
MLIDKIKARSGGIRLYGLVPPRLGTTPTAMEDIAALQIQRLQGLPLDGLVLYDIQDEASRTAVERPFPFMATEDAQAYAKNYLQALPVPKVVYRAVGKYPAEALTDYLAHANPATDLTVFVGAAAQGQDVTLSLPQAYALKQAMHPDLLLGGVVIPERHLTKRDEHLRVFDKMAKGCSYFVSQGVYDTNAALSFMSDYYYHSQQHGIAMAPIIFTFTPCGSLKTLEFMKWLGIAIPRWMENELTHAHDILQRSIEFAVQNWNTLQDYAATKNIPVGFNVESVAVRKVEVEASIELFRRMAA